MLKALGLSAILAVPSLAAAQTQKQDKKEYAPQVRHIDIGDGDEVIGEFARPDDPIVGPALHGRHVSLIKIRVTFVPEMIKSANDL